VELIHDHLGQAEPGRARQGWWAGWNQWFPEGRWGASEMVIDHDFFWVTETDSNSKFIVSITFLWGNPEYSELIQSGHHELD
jgi:hypothetical protein